MSQSSSPRKLTKLSKEKARVKTVVVVEEVEFSKILRTVVVVVVVNSKTLRAVAAVVVGETVCLTASTHKT